MNKQDVCLFTSHRCDGLTGTHVRKEATALLVGLILIDWIATVPFLCWYGSGIFAGDQENQGCMGCIENVTFPSVCVQPKDVKA